MLMRTMLILFLFLEDLVITAPILGRNVGDSEITTEFSVYDYGPRAAAPPPAVSHSMQRGNWKTGSTSSTSSESSCYHNDTLNGLSSLILPHNSEEMLLKVQALFLLDVSTPPKG